MPQPQRPDRHDAEWTKEDFTASYNLKRLWENKKAKLHLSQNKVARRWDITQAAVSRYINGTLRLNPEIILKFATSLEVDPITIDPRLGQFMRTRKHEYLYSLKVTHADYAPRILPGDWLNLDTLNKPKHGKLAAAHNNDTLLVGTFDAATYTLAHPLTQTPQPIPPGMSLHLVLGIIPQDAL
jgi:transcriptional regulator with XRE-family HTH domain